MTNNSLSKIEKDFVIDFSRKVKRDSFFLKEECSKIRDLLGISKSHSTNEIARNK